ncbi:hypothetical protein [Streptomyces sp. NBC_00057]|uniref:hypothetical protein n=1 Tax=Streptomyces sp. NBC_00057 TaxID=2975634 RepID=UPI0032535E33
MISRPDHPCVLPGIPSWLHNVAPRDAFGFGPDVLIHAWHAQVVPLAGPGALPGWPATVTPLSRRKKVFFRTS